MTTTTPPSTPSNNPPSLISSPGLSTINNTTLDDSSSVADRSSASTTTATAAAAAMTNNRRTSGDGPDTPGGITGPPSIQRTTTNTTNNTSNNTSNNSSNNSTSHSTGHSSTSNTTNNNTVRRTSTLTDHAVPLIDQHLGRTAAITTDRLLVASDRVASNVASGVANAMMSAVTHKTMNNAGRGGAVKGGMIAKSVDGMGAGAGGGGDAHRRPPRGLRPMHVRISVRVHHVAFLHPGLDNGSGAGGASGGGGTGGGGVGGTGGWGRGGGGFGGGVGNNSRWKRKGSAETGAVRGAPGLLNFGSKRGSWKNPKGGKTSAFGFGGGNTSGHGGGGGGDGNAATTAGIGGVGGGAMNIAGMHNKLHHEQHNVEQHHDHHNRNTSFAHMADAAEISEIVSAEAFRLSRDGIIQQHYALNNAAVLSNSTTTGAGGGAAAVGGAAVGAGLGAGSKRGSKFTMSTNPAHPPSTPTGGGGGGGGGGGSRIAQAEAARYYKECAARPKGYRRLVVSSAVPTDQVSMPAPPLVGKLSNLPSSAVATAKRNTIVGGGGGGGGGGLKSKSSSSRGKVLQKRNTWDFEVDSSMGFSPKGGDGMSSSSGGGGDGVMFGLGGQGEGETNANANDNEIPFSLGNNNTAAATAAAAAAANSSFRQGKKAKHQNTNDKNDNLFNNVEYQYIGPARTGPEFFQVLRYHGGATFGRYLPELACSVPKHSIGFELLKSKRRHAASTQPFVPEAPHIIWGDARDKMLSRIAKEGCPFIDARKFEYVSNASLRDTEFSESLMICGATMWVENAYEEQLLGHDGSSVSSPVKQHKHATKTMVKAEYYGGKITDGLKDGVKGVTKGTMGVVSSVEKGTKGVFRTVDKVGKKIIPSSHHKESTDTSSVTSETTQDSIVRRKKGGMRGMFKAPKKMKNVFKRGKHSRRKDDDGRSVDGSIASELDHDDMSVGSESIATNNEYFTDALMQADASGSIQEQVLEESEAEFTNRTVDGDSSHNEFEPVQTLERKVGVVEKTEDDNQSVKTQEFSVVKPMPYALVLDDIIDIQIVSFPDSDVIAKFPISVASVMVQRSMEDRINDPLKPSELTATLIQEPCAQELRWGVELKVTVRAVEVKPQIPRILPVPDFKLGNNVISVDAELAKVKDRLMSLGKSEEEIRNDLKDKEDEITKRDNDLDNAIVAAGFGRGEDQGAGINDVRLRQMFYDEREHKAIATRYKRRRQLNDEEKQLMRDARMDPSATIENRNEKDIQMLLDLNFPGIEEGYVSVVKRRMSTSEKLPLPLSPINETSSTSIGRLSLGDFPVDSMDGRIDPGSETIASVSLAMAQSLDICLSEFVGTPTVPVVQQALNQVRRTVSEGDMPTVTRGLTKQWCSDVANKVLVCGNDLNNNGDVKRTTVQLQSIIAKSVTVLGTSLEVDVPEFHTDFIEDSKEMSSQKNNSGPSSIVDPSKLIDWCTEVASKLEECAEELDDVVIDDDAEESIISSSMPSSNTSLIEGKATRFASTDLTIESANTINQNSNRKAVPRSSSSSIFSVMSSQKNASADDSDSVDSECSSPDPFSPEEEEINMVSLPSNTQRILNATSISTIKKAIPTAKSTPAFNVNTLMKSMKDSHFQLHRSLPGDNPKVSPPPLYRQWSDVSTAKGNTDTKVLEGKAENRLRRFLFNVLPYLLLVVAVFVLGVIVASKVILDL